MTTVEERLDRLEATNEKQKLQIERLQAAREIENMMSQYEYYHVNWRHKDVMAMYSKKPSTRVYFGEMGYWEGSDAPQKAWALLDRLSPRPGEMHFHPTFCPIVEVAADGKTAKGVWTTWGFETMPDPKTGKLLPQYSWGTYGVDFIKEDGTWKFWHFHIYRLCMYTYDKPWTELDGWNPTAQEGQGMHVPDDIKPNGPGIDDYPYRRDKVVVIKPDPPLPYETWKDTTMY